MSKIKHHFGFLPIQPDIRVGSVSVLGLLYTVSIGLVLSGRNCSPDLVRCHCPCSLQLQIMTVQSLLVPVITLQKLEGALAAHAGLFRGRNYVLVAGRSNLRLMLS